ncbi:hypothetical protein K438DRAFT_833964 [Mycena galopus ATCC 62051]|nr:hypothetical protein K438DRAFT_833964 [Mycena galopus ATCC 62051]
MIQKQVTPAARSVEHNNIQFKGKEEGHSNNSVVRIYFRLFPVPSFSRLRSFLPFGSRRTRREGGDVVSFHFISSPSPFRFHWRKGAGGSAARSKAHKGKVARSCGCAGVDAHGEEEYCGERSRAWRLGVGERQGRDSSGVLAALRAHAVRTGIGWESNARREEERNEAGGGMRWGEQRRRARPTPRLQPMLNQKCLSTLSPIPHDGSLGISLLPAGR